MPLPQDPTILALAAGEAIGVDTLADELDGLRAGRYPAWRLTQPPLDRAALIDNPDPVDAARPGFFDTARLPIVLLEVGVLHIPTSTVAVVRVRRVGALWRTLAPDTPVYDP